MKNIDDLMDSAEELAQRGLSKGEIADELNVSRETASWLVERSEPQTATTRPEGPHDIHIDWSPIGRDANRLFHVSAAIADILSRHDEDIDLTIGIEKAGAPIATAISRELDTDMGTYAPSKHQWDDEEDQDLDGTFSRNFAQLRGRECYVIDDIITSGTTMTETVEAIRAQGGEPVACAVLVDKQGVGEIADVPVYSLMQVISVGEKD